MSTGVTSDATKEITSGSIQKLDHIYLMLAERLCGEAMDGEAATSTSIWLTGGGDKARG